MKTTEECFATSKSVKIKKKFLSNDVCSFIAELTTVTDNKRSSHTISGIDFDKNLKSFEKIYDYNKRKYNFIYKSEKLNLLFKNYGHPNNLTNHHSFNNLIPLKKMRTLIFNQVVNYDGVNDLNINDILFIGESEIFDFKNKTILNIARCAGNMCIDEYHYNNLDVIIKKLEINGILNLENNEIIIKYDNFNKGYIDGRILIPDEYFYSSITQNEIEQLKVDIITLHERTCSVNALGIIDYLKTHDQRMYLWTS